MGYYKESSKRMMSRPNKVLADQKESRSSLEDIVI